jgi:hypothetical protein
VRLLRGGVRWAGRRHGAVGSVDGLRGVLREADQYHSNVPKWRLSRERLRPAPPRCVGGQSRSVKPSRGHGRSDVRATRKRLSAHRRRTLSNFKRTPPYKPPCRSWWELHALLTSHLKARGFSSASLIALRVLSEGVDGALSTVMVAFYLAVDDARVEWARRR